MNRKSLSISDEFIKIGRLGWEQGLFSTHGGNMSIRLGDKIIITRRGSMLGALTEEDIIETSLYENDTYITVASTEIIVHRAIYKNTSALAIFHSHPPITVAQSLISEEIVGRFRRQLHTKKSTHSISGFNSWIPGSS